MYFPKFNNFFGVPFFHRDHVSILDSRVYGGKRSRYIKRNPVRFSQHSHLIGTYFISHIPVYSNSVGTSNNQVNHFLTHQESCGIISNNRYWDFFFHQFKGCQPKPLKPRSGLISNNFYVFSISKGSTYHTQGRPITTSC